MMNADQEKPDPRNGRPPAKTMACEEIQALLYDYLTHAIGRARGELIREHIRKCPTCRAAAADVQASIDVLKSASSDEPKAPMTLSGDRRKRMWRAFMHPGLDWLYGHHIVVSIVVAVVAVIVTLFVIKGVKIIWKVREDGPPREDLRDVIELTYTNATQEKGWYMIRGEDGRNWFYHPKAASNRTDAVRRRQ